MMSVAWRSFPLWQFVLTCLQSISAQPKADVDPSYFTPSGHAPRNLEPLYFRQRVDHFDSANSDTWMQVYFVNDGNWSGAESQATVFLSIGGEGALKTPGSDFVTDQLPQTRGILFSVEHRYYGCHNPASCPYNVSDPPANYLRHLTSSQALEDLAAFQRFATQKYGLVYGTKWILVGGSYPGVLAALGRALHPELFYAAVASSAPVRGVVDFRGFEDAVSDAYALQADGVGGSDACRKSIIDAHQQVADLLSTESGRQHLATFFDLKDSQALETLDGRRKFSGCGVAHFPAQTNDPLCEEPACGIRQVCQIMLNESLGTSSLERLQALRSIQNASGASKTANSMDAAMINCEMDTVWESAPHIPRESLYWAYQTCNEYGFYQTCENGSRCLYVRGLISFQEDNAHKPDHFCKEQFNISRGDVTKRIKDSNEYREALVAGASRILWVNGNVDPWSVQSHRISPRREQPVIYPVDGASHCAWMNAAKDGEQQSIVAARRQIYNQLTLWLAEKDMPTQGAQIADWGTRGFLDMFLLTVALGFIALTAAHAYRKRVHSSETWASDLAAPLHAP